MAEKSAMLSPRCSCQNRRLKKSRHRHHRRSIGDTLHARSVVLQVSKNSKIAAPVAAVAARNSAITSARSLPPTDSPVSRGQSRHPAFSIST
uniref:Uncharacterized protein n=1 Tax=Chelativorans sp. (strain BNC1) TaxID=266779 RepID=Q11BT2_CHESB